MSEQTMRQLVVRGLRSMDAVSVENPAHPGTPDVNYVEGWLELKQLPRWPRDEAKVIICSHFRTGQRVWIKKRARAGGQVHVLLQVGRDWLLLPGREAAVELGKSATRARLEEMAVRVWHGRMDMKELKACLLNLRS
jgi:hypothetical protein